MLTYILTYGAWGFQSVLFGVLVFTLVYARRLDKSILQMRADRHALQELVDQIGTSVSSAISATERLKEQAGQSFTALEEACKAAAASTTRLDELISQANIAADTQKRAESKEGFDMSDTSAAVIDLKPQDAVASPRGVLMAKPNPLHRSNQSRRPAKLQSRAERDLARMLLDAT
ncbi:unnamed protein product [Acidocella sp. C78]|uniref:DUF6468 domain-containing protein n=1 Tax=Acidocella sp. C78 TaxID=1671486 RepID=UPI00191B9718|nr:hypothetical protein [Acidocella sp. C78]CAG4921993.1 unnamed protein product [Acidocella sp. C78]